MMERETFFYAYEGQNYLHFAIDLIEKYESTEIKKLENYISSIELSPSEIVSSLQGYQISVKGDVKFSGGQNDQRYFCINTRRNFDGLIEAFGNSRVALLCDHYIITDEYEEDGKWGLLQRVYKSVDEIIGVRVVLTNFEEEPFTQDDEELLRTVLEKFEDIVGMKIGICHALEKGTYRKMKFLSISDFLVLARHIRENLL